MIPVVDGHTDALLRVWRSGESLRAHGGSLTDGQFDAIGWLRVLRATWVV